MNWIEIKAEFSSPPADWSVVVDLLDRLGCPNTLLKDDPARITACVVETEGSAERVVQIESELTRAGASVVVTNYVPDQDWAEIWKAHFKPRKVGKRFMIRPTWEDAPGDLTIVFDPGQAFGTGDHPTTRMCLEMMEQVDLGGKRVLDLGCGSGVLAIGAKLLGAAEVVAIDIDPQSVEVARENFAINRVDVEARLGDAPAGTGWDLVVSNIISATLILLAPDVRDVVQAGSNWIVSGIIVQNWPDVLASAARAGFTVVDQKQEDGWVAARFTA